MFDINSLLSAIIGGAFTLLGVIITLYREKALRKIEQNEKAHPFFSTIDLGDSRITDANQHTLIFSADERYEEILPHLCATIINSDKTEFIIDKIRIGSRDYYPICKELISKGMSCIIKLNYKDNINENEITMHIVDVNHQKRVYKMIHRSAVVIDFEEV